MKFSFNYEVIKDSSNGKIAKQIFNDSINLLNSTPIDSDKINQMQFSYQYNPSKGATIAIIFERVAGLVTDHISYEKKIKNFKNSQEIFNQIISIVKSSGYEIDEREFAPKDSLHQKKSVQIRPKIKE